MRSIIEDQINLRSRSACELVIIQANGLKWLIEWLSTPNPIKNPIQTSPNRENMAQQAGREDQVYMAKLAEQAERYDEMVGFMKVLRARVDS